MKKLFIDYEKELLQEYVEFLAWQEKQALEIMNECYITLNEETSESDFLRNAERDIKHMNDYVKKLDKVGRNNKEINQFIDTLKNDIDDIKNKLQKVKDGDLNHREAERAIESLKRENTKKRLKMVRKFRKAETNPVLKAIFLALAIPVVGLIAWLGIRNTRKMKFYREVASVNKMQADKKQEKIDSLLNNLESETRRAA